MLGRQALLWAPLPGPRTTRRLPLSNGMWPKGRQGRCLPDIPHGRPDFGEFFIGNRH